MQMSMLRKWFFVLLLLLSLLSVSALDCQDLQITTHQNTLDGSVVQTLFANAEKTQIYILTSKNSVYKSSDSGRSFQNQMSYLSHSSEIQPTYNQAGVQKMFKTTLDGHVFFMGFGYQYWTTTGADQSYNYYYNADESWTEFIASTETGDAIIGTRLSANCLTLDGCYQSLYYSSDWGAHWKLLRNYVFEFSWGNHESIYLTSVPEDLQAGNQNSIDKQKKHLYRVNSDGEILYQSESGFYKYENIRGILYAARQYNNTNEFLISSDEGTTFLPAMFSDTISDFPQDASAYTILDNSGDVTFVHVNRANSIYYGSLYEANTADGQFWLTLRSNRVSPGTHIVDFQQVLGLQGIYIANQYNISLLLGDSPANEQYVTSRISINKGGQWSKIPVPANSLCSSQDCSLHLEGLVDGKGILTDEKVVGLLLAIGNEGTVKETRIDNLNLYLSRNAGATWERIQQGPRIYNWGNYGGLILSTSGIQTTNNLTFTWNQGISWDECSFSSTPMEVEQIIPLSVDSLDFLVFGSSSEDGNVSGFTTFLSFSNNLTTHCAGQNAPGEPQSDFESWSTEWNGECLLGKNTTYTRRKQESICIVTSAPFAVGSEPCECIIQDYICDGLCYSQEIENGIMTCVLEDNCETEESLTDNDCEETPSGYRLIVGDSCEGGVDLSATPQNCETSKHSAFTAGFLSYALLAVFICLLIFSILLLVLLLVYKKNQSLNDKLSPFIPEWCTRDPSIQDTEDNDMLYSQLGDSTDDLFD